MTRRIFGAIGLSALLGWASFAEAATTLNSPSQQAAVQPAFTDLSGSAACSQLPALTGNVTTSAGSCSTTIGSNVVTNAMLATAGANTMKGNWTGSSGNLSDNTMPSCADSGGNHLNYVNGTGVTCGTGGSVAIVQASKTTNYSVLSGDNGTYFDNIGAVAEVDFTLPTSPATEQHNCYFAGVAQIVKVIAPASTKINIGTTASAAAGNVASSAAIGNAICLVALSSTLWVAQGASAGTWTVN